MVVQNSEFNNSDYCQNLVKFCPVDVIGSDNSTMVNWTFLEGGPLLH